MVSGRSSLRLTLSLTVPAASLAAPVTLSATTGAWVWTVSLAWPTAFCVFGLDQSWLA